MSENDQRDRAYPEPEAIGRIRHAKDEAERARREAGLPPVDDGPFTEEAMAAWRKRGKKKR